MQCTLLCVHASDSLVGQMFVNTPVVSMSYRQKRGHDPPSHQPRRDDCGARCAPGRHLCMAQARCLWCGTSSAIPGAVQHGGGRPATAQGCIPKTSVRGACACAACSFAVVVVIMSRRLWRLVPHTKLVVASVMRRMLRVVERRLRLEQRDPVQEAVGRLMDKMLRRVCACGSLLCVITGA